MLPPLLLLLLACNLEGLLATVKPARRITSRSLRSAAGYSSQPALPRLTLPAEAVMVRLRAAAGESEHIARLVEEPFLPELLADEAMRRSFARRKASLKEASEAYAMALGVRKLLGRLGAAPDGEGAVVLDVCSGRGLTSLLLSFLLPRARVVALDSNADMELSHVAQRDNVEFVQLDIFRRDAAATLRRVLADGGDGGAPLGIACGMHLCGALSPRLLSLACHMRGVHALLLCPCCLKGSLGEHAKQVARRLGRPNYEVLVETLADLAGNELRVACGLSAADDSTTRMASARAVAVEYDAQMLSPKNGLVLVLKPPEEEQEAARAAAAGSDDSAPPRALPPFANPAVERMLVQYRAHART